MFSIDEFTAVINPPEAAILAVGRTEEKAVVVEGQVEIRKRMRVTIVAAVLALLGPDQPAADDRWPGSVIDVHRHTTPFGNWVA